MLKDSVQAEREQEADCARIDAAIRLALTAIAAVANSDEAHKRRCDLRDRTVLSVADARRNIIRRAKQAKETRRKMIEALFHDRVPSQSTIEYAAMLHDVSTSALVHHLRYLIRSGDLDRVEGVYHAFENRADRHHYLGSFDEIAAQGAFSDSGDELAKRLARICRLADETDAKLTDLWFSHINPETRNGIAHEAVAEAQPNPTAGSSLNSSGVDGYDFEHSGDELISRPPHTYEQHNQGSNDYA
jgi:hypothetical protein